MIHDGVREIWSDVLGVDVPADGTFFSLGGHSLAAFRILARITEEYAVELDVITLFEDPTVTEFADQVAAAVAGSVAGEPAEVSPLALPAGKPAAGANNASTVVAAGDAVAVPVARLEAIAERTFLTPEAIVLAAFATTVARLADVTDLSVLVRGTMVRLPVPLDWSFIDVAEETAVALAGTTDASLAGPTDPAPTDAPTDVALAGPADAPTGAVTGGGGEMGSGEVGFAWQPEGDLPAARLVLAATTEGDLVTMELRHEPGVDGRLIQERLLETLDSPDA